MSLKLPEEKPPKPKKRAMKIARTPVEEQQPDPLAPTDTIEYSQTMEVSVRRGQKAWIKVGTTSSVRQGETTEEARKRVTSWVDRTLDERIDEMSE